MFWFCLPFIGDKNQTLHWHVGAAGIEANRPKRIFIFVFWTIWLNLFLFCLHFISTAAGIVINCFEFCLQLAKKIGMASTTAT
jgi:hypothetical protein